MAKPDLIACFDLTRRLPPPHPFAPCSCDAISIPKGQGFLDGVARGPRHQLPLHPHLPAATLHQHHPNFLQLLPEHHLPAGIKLRMDFFLWQAWMKSGIC